MKFLAMPKALAYYKRPLKVAREEKFYCKDPFEKLLKSWGNRAEIEPRLVILDQSQYVLVFQLLVVSKTLVACTINTLRS